MSHQPADLANYVAHVLSVDPDLDREISGVLRKKHKPRWLRASSDALRRLPWEVSEAVAPRPVPGYTAMEPESIVLRYGRPVLAIKDGKVQLVFADADSETWRARLTKSSTQIASAIPSVGRVDVTNHPSGLDYMGTGWVVDDGVIITNRHVALTFAEADGKGFSFLVGFDRTNAIGVDVDFLEEVGNPARKQYAITRVIYIARDSEPDVALLALDIRPGEPAPPKLALLGDIVPDKTMVATIGYPARDNRVPDRQLMDKIFGAVYDKKRLAPGFTSAADGGTLPHDCTTLGGNSGAPLIDLATGKVCGLHFSGEFLKSNYAVPAPVVSALVTRVKNGEAALLGAGIQSGAGGAMPQAQSVSAGDAGEELCVTIPIEVRVRVGAPIGANAPLVTVAGSAPRATAASPANVTIEAAVAEARRLFAARPDVVSIGAGWQFSDGWITDTKAVVVAVRSKLSPSELDARGVRPLPSLVLGFPVDVRPATLEEVNPEAVQLEAYARTWESPYQTWPEVPLKEVNEKMKATLHASPDAGWPLLSAFLAKTAKTLTVGMYDFTAPHIVDAVQQAGKPSPRTLSLVLQANQDIGKGTKKDDIPDAETVDRLQSAMKKRFEFAWASVHGANALFRSAYHIKVAVRDGGAFWLSSGNWQSSNQPDDDPINGEDTSPPLLSTCNREWHAIVEGKTLSTIFEKYLIRDREQAEARAKDEAVAPPEPMVWVPEGYFQPSETELEGRAQYFPPETLDKAIRIQPLLTPDNYSDHVVALINSATHHLYFQNQSLKIGPKGENPPHYENLLAALLKKQEDGIDVRIIIRRIGDLRMIVEGIKNYGFDTDTVKLQTNCHTKGIIVDGKVVMIGSQNWTGDGTGYNRDASLIFFDEDAAQYYEKLFLYDWNRIGKPKIDESLPPPELATGEEAYPKPGMVLMPLSRWLGES